MLEHTTILDELDRRAAEFRFPVLDNANVRFIAGRMRGFRLGEDWSIVFEILVFSPGEIAIVVDVYAFGPLVGPKQWKLFQAGGLKEVPGSPLWDEDGAWIDREGSHRVDVGGKEVLVSCRDDALDGVSVPREDCKDEIRFTRALVRAIGLESLIPTHLLVDHLPALGVASEVFALTNWDHPDVSRGEKPSESEALRSAAKFLCGETSSLNYGHYQDNLDSPRWDQQG